METTLVILTLNALHRAKRVCRDMPVQVVIPKPLPPRPNTILVILLLNRKGIHEEQRYTKKIST